jgi:hypothetical protein
VHIIIVIVSRIWNTFRTWNGSLGVMSFVKFLSLQILECSTSSSYKKGLKKFLTRAYSFYPNCNMINLEKPIIYMLPLFQFHLPKGSHFWCLHFFTIKFFYSIILQDSKVHYKIFDALLRNYYNQGHQPFLICWLWIWHNILPFLLLAVTFNVILVVINMFLCDCGWPCITNFQYHKISIKFVRKL